MNTLPPLVVIAGPTACGKSALALALSRLRPATIVNADASQVYRDLRLLSARPSPEDEAETPHRLFGHVDGAQAHSAAIWAAEARAAIGDAHEAGRLPVLVGGTGLYIRTLLDGIAPVPEIGPDVRQAVRRLPVAEAHAALGVEDPGAANRLSPADTTRVSRALEVVRSTGRTLSDWQAERVGGIGDVVRVVPVVLVPPRDWLIERCDARFEMMAEAGAIEEARMLLARELDPALPVMRAIGVRELIGYLRGETTLANAIEAGRLATRQYAKRQYTWFRNQPPLEWPREETMVNEASIAGIAELLQNGVTGAMLSKPIQD